MSILTPITDARGHAPHAPCVSLAQIDAEFSSSSKSGWGGARPNSGGPRPNSGGARDNSGGPRPNSGGPRDGAGRPRKPLVQPMSSVLRWYCVRTKHREELIADTEMRLAGFTVFMPTIWKPPEEMRRYTNGSIRRARPARVVPMFRRCVLAQFDISEPGWEEIKDLPGVEDFYGMPNAYGGVTPSQISDRAIELILKLDGFINGCLYPPGHHDTPFDPGTSIRLTDGPLSDRTYLCQVSDGKRVEWLMKWFNRDNVKTTAKQSAVEAV